MRNANPLKWKTTKIVLLLLLAGMGGISGLVLGYALQFEGASLDSTSMLAWALLGAFVMAAAGYGIRMTADD